ncbi:hypothetical protein [Burkholderia ambifaria]|uniref:hypothetical protein n=1 Tax=Burkholderia ambifaria TaxID=152480 RepID=UPI000A5EF45B|nr:hypothetical protein [Burkholderia ambifaria]
MTTLSEDNIVARVLRRIIGTVHFRDCGLCGSCCDGLGRRAFRAAARIDRNR